MFECLYSSSGVVSRRSVSLDISLQPSFHHLGQHFIAPLTAVETFGQFLSSSVSVVSARQLGELKSERTGQFEL
jgi:hypothetical protein